VWKFADRTASSSGSKNKPSKKSSAFLLLLAGFLFGLLFHSEDGSDVFLKNVR
jgi:hypothetical protein